MRAWPATLLLLWPAPALAWNPHGHMVVADAAYRQLKPVVRAKVAALLKLNPRHGQWTAGVSQELDRVAFLRASYWADEIRTDSSYTGDPPSGTPPAGYLDRHRHTDWHYINRPFSLDATAVRPPAVPNVQTQIAVLRQALAAPGNAPEVRSYSLVWLLHLVGDVHQPNHCATRFSRLQPQGDRGATWVTLSADPKDHLHGFWDRALGESDDVRVAQQVAASLPAPPPALAAVTDEAAWVEEGFREAQRSVYVDPIALGPGPFEITAAYANRARQVSSTRIALAGARLARLLNAALK